MASNILPPAQYLRQCFSYDPETGFLTWKRRPLSHFNTPHGFAIWNGKFPNRRAGCISNGRPEVSINNKIYRQHRIIWKLVTGKNPSETIDHINGVPSDNRICNLREATNSQNRWNTKRGKGRDLPKGVSPFKGGKWQVHISAHYKRQYIGIFKTIEEAAKAYRDAADKLHGDFAFHKHR